MHHNVPHKVMQSTPRCLEINWQHAKEHNFNIVIKCSLYGSWKVTYLENVNTGDIFNERKVCNKQTSLN